MCVASLPSHGAFAVVEIGGGGLAGSRRRILDFVRHDDAIITTIGINDTASVSTDVDTQPMGSGPLTNLARQRNVLTTWVCVFA